VPSFDIPLFRPFKPTPLRASKLFHNNRNGTFTDVARQAGLDVVAYVKGAAWGDYDNDGRLDLVLTQSYGPTLRYRNAGRDARGRWRFEEQGLEPRRGLVTWFWTSTTTAGWTCSCPATHRRRRLRGRAGGGITWGSRSPQARGSSTTCAATSRT
jgi:hypothetical protein